MSARFQLTRGLDASAQDCFCIDRDGAAIRNPFDPGAVEAQLRSFDECVAQLVNLARHQRNRYGEQADEPHDVRGRPIDVHRTSIMLRHHVLGDSSLGVLCPFQESVLIDVDEYCASLPLELIRDQYIACVDRSHRWAMPMADQVEARDACPCQHPLITARGPLALLKQLGIQPGQGHPVATREALTAHKALVFGCPDYGRASSALGEEEPLGEEDHLREVYDLLCQHYSDVKLKMSFNATRDALLEALDDPSYGVVYVFARGGVASDKRTAHILTSGLEPVCRQDLPKHLNGSPFLFLNCCWLARDRWSEISGAATSLAHEFLRRGAVGVVAPLCSVVSSQAARAAADFFKVAVGTTVGRALEQVRQNSYKLYDQQELPDIPWFAYRLLGDPDSCLPTRAWTSDGALVKSIFTPGAGRLLQTMEEVDEQADKSLTANDFVRRLAQITSVVTGMPLAGMVGALEKPSAPSHGADRSPVQSADFSMQLIFRDMLRVFVERTRKATRLSLSLRVQVDIPDFLDACPVMLLGPEEKPIRLLPAGETWLEDMVKKVREEAEGKVTTALKELTLINRRFTSGAAFLIQQMEHKARFCLSKAELETAVMDAFLAHFLIGNTILRGQSQEIARLRERLIAMHRGRGEVINRQDASVFLDDLLEIARRKAARVDEQTLFACRELMMRQPRTVSVS